MTARRSEVSAQPDDDALWRLELTELAALIRTRQVSSAEVTDATLRRIEKLDAGLKSHAFVMADSAVQAARTADAELARGSGGEPCMVCQSV
ncbi:hypothetical protein NIIDMKKI_05790 [Mycobacterium kansasii]|uniref:Amidase family protein n=1 Tax=Mycobacterium kansasii TaxID=1768 RepID=A0A7G1I538_MYCKA|nr:hypothetical protein NIIDMKKI_05790 [Mycobacterium kansasii]